MANSMFRFGSEEEPERPEIEDVDQEEGFKCDEPSPTEEENPSATARRITTGHVGGSGGYSITSGIPVTSGISAIGGTAGGGYVGGGVVGTVTPPGWGVPASPWTTTTTTSTRASVSKSVELPKRVTKKVLIAFLDPDDEDPTTNVIWAKVLLADDVSIDLSVNNPGSSQIKLALNLKDVFENE